MKTTRFPLCRLMLVTMLLSLGTSVVMAQSPMRTSTTLTSSHTNLTKPGDVITLSGRVVPLSELTSVTMVNLSIQNPDGSYAWNGQVMLDYNGCYSMQYRVVQSGYVRVIVQFAGNSYYRSSGSEMVIPIKPDIGVAIVVAGGSQVNSLYSTISYLSDMVVETFRRRSVPDDPSIPAGHRIWYLNAEIFKDLDGDGRSDVDATPTLANLTSAIRTWAPDLIQTKDDYGNWSADAVLKMPLTLYLIGPIEPSESPLPPESSEFQFDERDESEAISASALGALLDEFENTIKQRFINANVQPPAYVPINIIIEGTSSGDFIPALSKMGRCVVTSTNSVRVPNQGRSYFASGGSVSLTSYFLSRIGTGQYIHPSWAYAQLNILGNPALVGQYPQIDADGDGQPNEISDEIKAVYLPLESRSDGQPRIQNTMGQTTLRDVVKAFLWTYIDDPKHDLSTVEVMVIPPVESCEETHTIQMSKSTTVSDRWEAEYYQFYGQGTYTIVYTATDAAGNTSYSMVKHIIRYETQDESQVPANPSNLQYTALAAHAIDVSWSTSESPDVQGYRVYIKPSDGVEVLWGDVGNVHRAHLGSLNLTPNVTHTIRVTAYDRVPLESGGVSIDFILSNPTHSLTLTSLNGTVAKNPDLPAYEGGAVVTLTANAAIGYHFVSWTGDVPYGAETNNPLVLTMDQDKNIIANFAVNSHSLNIVAVNGTVVKNPEQSLYNHGTTVQLSATPISGYTFTGWGGDVNGSSNPIMVTVDGNMNIIANFLINTYTIKATAASHGTLLPVGDIVVSYGSSQAFSMAPDVNYHISSVVVDGTELGPLTSYVFPAVTTNHTIDVFFSGDPGSIAGSMSVAGGAVANVTVSLLDVNGNPIQGFPPVVSDVQGRYSFMSVPSERDYQVMIVEPIGLTADQNPKLVNVQPGVVSTLDFGLTQSTVASQARGLGYWKLQYEVASGGNGHADESAEKLDIYVATVQERYTPHFPIFQDCRTVNDWLAVLKPIVKGSMRAKVKQQLAALLMNLVSIKLNQFTVVSADGRTAGDALTHLSRVVINAGATNSELEAAKAIGEDVNGLVIVAAGLIPAGNVLYKGEAESIVWNFDAVKEFVLRQNHPNPFNPSTIINYELPEASQVTLRVYNTLGNEVSTLVDKLEEPGIKSVRFDASRLSSGMYFYRLQAGEYVETKKMILLK